MWLPSSTLLNPEAENHCNFDMVMPLDFLDRKARVKTRWDRATVSTTTGRLNTRALEWCAELSTQDSSHLGDAIEKPPLDSRYTSA
ncbi:hypothetical protein J6590_104357 [Homalodisca vitripennis]|nr:hypothetical protein J6590_104357 [Homalodisca vitripennis]